MSTVSVHTTQNVRIDYATAGLRARAGAWLIDGILLLVSYLLLLYVVEQWGAGLNEEVALRLGPIFWTVLYFWAMETLGHGRSPGKRLLQLRVIRLDGEEPTAGDYLVRALFLLPDVLFTGGMLAVLLVTTGGRRQRLGDVVARTAVIRTDPGTGISLDEVLALRQREQHVARYPSVQRLSEEDMLTVQQCLLRYRRYRNRAHREALQLARARVLQLLEIEAPEEDAEAFLETLLLDYIVLTR